MDCNWMEAYRSELERGHQAREQANEGMARVCARRAAGVLVRAYFVQIKLSAPGKSVLNDLRALVNDPSMTEHVRDLAEHFITQITPEHILPGDVDLLVEVERLREALFPNC